MNHQQVVFHNSVEGWLPFRAQRVLEYRNLTPVAVTYVGAKTPHEACNVTWSLSQSVDRHWASNIEGGLTVEPEHIRGLVLPVVSGARSMVVSDVVVDLNSQQVFMVMESGFDLMPGGPLRDDLRADAVIVAHYVRHNIRVGMPPMSMSVVVAEARKVRERELLEGLQVTKQKLLDN